jgi:hypothetical protein
MLRRSTRRCMKWDDEKESWLMNKLTKLVRGSSGFTFTQVGESSCCWLLVPGEIEWVLDSRVCLSWWLHWVCLCPSILTTSFIWLSQALTFPIHPESEMLELVCNGMDSSREFHSYSNLRYFVLLSHKPQFEIIHFWKTNGMGWSYSSKEWIRVKEPSWLNVRNSVIVIIIVYSSNLPFPARNVWQRK